MTSADDHRVITQLFFHIRYVFVDCLTRVSGCGKYVSYFFRVPGCVDATFNSPPPPVRKPSSVPYFGNSQESLF